MDRRTFLKTTTAAAAVTTASGAAQAGTTAEAPAIIKIRQELRIGVPAQGPLKRNAEVFAKEIEVATDGAVLLHLLDHAGPAANALQENQLDGAFGHLPDLLDAPELSLFSGLPDNLALSPQDFSTWLHAGAGNLFLEEAAAGYGVAAFTAGHSGAGTGLWSDRLLNGRDGFGNARVATIGLGRDIIKILQAKSPAAADIETQANLIEPSAQPMDAVHDLPVHIRRIWYEDGLHQQGFATSLVLSLAAWHRLRPPNQLVVQTFALAAMQHDLAGISVNSRLVAPAVMKRLPVGKKSLPPDIKAEIAAAARQISYDILPRNAVTDRAFQAYASFVESMTGRPLPRPTATAERAIS